MNDVEKFTIVLTNQVQTLEDVFWSVYVNQRLDNAFGVVLDTIGKLVGQPRNGLEDDDYRRYIRARISTNKSRGTIEDVIKVARLILDDANAVIVIDNQGQGTYVVRVTTVAVEDPLADILISFLKSATSAGVRIILESSTAVPGTTFKWDTAGRGWDSVPFLDARD